jgi:putative intracellular protease/amidase
VKQADCDTVFYPGGRGPLWDLVEDKNSVKLIESFLTAGKVIVLVSATTSSLLAIRAILTMP